MSKDTQLFFMSTTLFILSLVLEILFDVLFSNVFSLSTNVGLFQSHVGHITLTVQE